MQQIPSDIKQATFGIFKRSENDFALCSIKFDCYKSDKIPTIESLDNENIK